MLETASIVALAVKAEVVASAVTSLSSSIGIIFASVIAGLGSISGVCSAIVSVLPHPTSDNWYHKLHHILNIIAFNVGNAKNKVTGVVPLREA